jgi:hypothetical protein
MESVGSGAVGRDIFVVSGLSSHWEAFLRLCTVQQALVHVWESK